MTGFSRASGGHGVWRWAWEIKAVNARGLDVRLRLPSAFDGIEIEARALVARKLSRGACQINLTAERAEAPVDLRVNEHALRSLVDIVSRIPVPPALRPASLDGLLALRGIVEVVETREDEGELLAERAAALGDLEKALDHLIEMRSSEGAALRDALAARVDRIGELAVAADECPARKPDAVRARLERAISELTGGFVTLDPVRLHQEAILLAAKADIREEIDRLLAHVAAARRLLASAEPAGRKLDFLAQEFGREANTLCAKANDAMLSGIGMELKVEIEQFREQAQNIE